MGNSTKIRDTQPATLSVTTSYWPSGTWLWLLVGALLLAYAAQWLTGGSAALTFGGYDLAEWTSLPPEVRSHNPPLVTSFLLRFPLTAITLVFALALPYRRYSSGWTAAGLALLALVAAQLPPLEFFTIARTDPNYGQQAALATVSLVGSILALATQLTAWRALLAAVCAGVGAATAVAGVLSAQAMIAGYGIGATITAAPWLAALLFVIAAFVCAFRFIRSFAAPVTR